MGDLEGSGGDGGGEGEGDDELDLGQSCTFGKHVSAGGGCWQLQQNGPLGSTRLAPATCFSAVLEWKFSSPLSITRTAPAAR